MKWHFIANAQHSLCLQTVTPPYQTGRTCPTADVQPKPCVGARSRKPRVPYTEEETHNLMTGVQKVGKHWSQILCTYQFHPSRTAVDLMEKYKRMMVSGTGLHQKQ